MPTTTTTLTKRQWELISIAVSTYINDYRRNAFNLTMAEKLERQELLDLSKSVDESADKAPKGADVDETGGTGDFDPLIINEDGTAGAPAGTDAQKIFDAKGVDANGLPLDKSADLNDTDVDGKPKKSGGKASAKAPVSATK